MNTLEVNIIGAGKAGATLAILLSGLDHIKINTICDCDSTKLSAIYDKVKADKFTTHINELKPADVYFITTPDDLIVPTCKEIIPILNPGEQPIFVHCSGALPSSILQGVITTDCHAASVHPIKSFAEPEKAAETFAGTYCGFEGSKAAVSTLKSIFVDLNANCFDINPERKAHYHAAAVFSCNYLNVLVELGLQTYEKAGIDRNVSMHILEDIAKDTISNIFASSPSKALTGPIARGDASTVQKHLTAFDNKSDQKLLSIYKILGEVAIDLSEDQGTAEMENIQLIKSLLTN